MKLRVKKGINWPRKKKLRQILSLDLKLTQESKLNWILRVWYAHPDKFKLKVTVYVY